LRHKYAARIGSLVGALTKGESDWGGNLTGIGDGDT